MCWVCLIAYSICLGLLLYNCRWYLCEELRYKRDYVLSFYLLSIIVITTRTISYLVVIIWLYQKEHYESTLITAQDF